MVQEIRALAQALILYRGVIYQTRQPVKAGPELMGWIWCGQVWME